MILVITGNGKGKTTSAIGTAIRSAGWHKKTAIVFFDKGGTHYGEQSVLDLLADKIDTFRFGLERFNEEKQEFRFDNLPGDLEEAEKGIKKLHELFEQNYSLIIADELINAMNLGLIEEDKVKALVDACPEETHLMLTGRNVPKWLDEKASLVSTVDSPKHPFQTGTQAIKGIDF